MFKKTEIVNMTDSNIHSLGAAREKRVENDEKRRKELQDKAVKVTAAMSAVLDLAVTDIRNPEELKEIIDTVRGLVNNDILEKLLDIEVEHNLDTIEFDDE